MQPFPEVRYAAETLRETHRRLDPVLPDTTHLALDESGWWMVLSWEQGPALDDVRAHLAPDETGHWIQERERATWRTATGEVHLFRKPHPRAIALTALECAAIVPCNCRGDDTPVPEEAWKVLEETFEHDLQAVDGDRVEAHPHLTATGIPTADLERMTELLVALAGASEEYEEYEKALCNAGHLPGLQEITLAIEEPTR